MTRLAAADRRRQLLEVAADLFAERGYGGTSTAQLAAGAGVTEPILYRHFESKLDLFVTLVGEVGREGIERWQQRLAAIDEPAARLRALVDGNPATSARGRGVYRVMLGALNERPRERRVAAAVRAHVTRLHRFLADELSRLQKAGVVRDDEPASALAWVLVDAAIGSGLAASLAGEGRRRPQSALAALLRPPG